MLTKIFFSFFFGIWHHFVLNSAALQQFGSTGNEEKAQFIEICVKKWILELNYDTVPQQYRFFFS